jgi:uncharacterized protein
LFLGLFGWKIFSYFRIPVAELLGAMAAVAFFRIFVFDIPLSPNFFSPLIQIFLGLFIGSKVTRKKVIYLRNLAKPALIIVGWVMITAFALGIILYRVTELDLITAILSSALGGLPEMTIIALETNADATTVVVIKTIRLVLTLVLLPIIFEKWMNKNHIKQNNSYTGSVYQKDIISFKTSYGFRKYCKILKNALAGEYGNLANITRIMIMGVSSFAIATVGGLLFRYLGVPAGAMVGGMFFIITASMLGFRVKTVSVNTITLLQVGLGIVLADNITIDTFSMFASSAFLLAILINVLFVFATFFLIIYLIQLVTDWDLQTCFLAAAPAGLTVMTVLAIKYEKDIFNISMLHLCRLIVIKAALPFILMAII